MKTYLRVLVSLIVAMFFAQPLVAVALTHEAGCLSGTLEKVQDIVGGKSYFFSTLDGSVISNVPNNDFDPLSADQQTLANLGYPPRPTNESELRRWISAVPNLEKGYIPKICVDPSGSGFSASANNPNWSGYVATSSNPSAYLGGAAKLIEPSIDASSSCPSAQLGSWVGLGGINQPLIQTGTAWGQGQYYAWAEWLTPTIVNAPMILQNPVIHANDDVRISLTRSLVPADNGKTVFTIVNMTNGTHQTATKYIPASYYYGGTVEYVDERPAIGASTSTYPLANFGQALWSLVQVEKNTSTGSQFSDLATQGETRLSMVAGNTTYAAPDLMSSGSSFTDRYKTCLP